MQTVSEIKSHALESELTQLCGFRVGSAYYAVPVLSVQEVVKPHRMTSIPLSSDVVRGLMNLRGQIVTSISLKKIFGIEEDLTKDYINIIVKSSDSHYALAVDEVLDVIDVESSKFESTPTTIDPKIREFIKGVFKLEKRLLILLDLEEILKTH